MATKVRIVRDPEGHYRVQVKKWFTWNTYYLYCYNLKHAEEVAYRILNPVIKEYE